MCKLCLLLCLLLFRASNRIDLIRSNMLRQYQKRDYDEAYFKLYADPAKEMDRQGSEAYRNAINFHKDFIKDKVVVDVGCGTAILSIFSARAGAKRVYAIEASDIAMQATRIVADSNLSDIIRVLHGRVEDVEIDEEVDVIISEWMGYTLLHENMLGRLITARDRWLRPGGLILPSMATLYMAPFTNTKRYEQSIDFWHSVYGIDMSAMIPLVKQSLFDDPSVMETITNDNILALPQEVKSVDCRSVTIADLVRVTNTLKFHSLKKAPLHGFAFWFNVDFNSETYGDPSLILSTAPGAPSNNRQQKLIYIYDPIELKEDQLVEVKVTLSQNQVHARFMNVHLEYAIEDQIYVKETVLRSFN